MKRLLAFLMAMLLVFSVCAFAETEEEGDDSNPEPVDMMEDEEETSASRVLVYGDEGDDVTAIQTRLQELEY